jgi:soluble lytic murein transglycosylase
MGSYYLRHVLDDLGHPILAAAAYNAGPGRARRWRDERSLEGAIYVETIPFNETRDYVKRVFANAWFYHSRLDGKAPSLKALLGTVGGRGIEPAGAVASTLP